ncbi:MAG: HDOD domain-containing protein [Desulfobacterales bacterium]|jgi:putative nucleotidyltransferase with HDIG domain|nr:HDOD domain-containing protein [Desulfobacterales bacterium]
MTAIQELIKEIKSLKPIPQIANQIMQIAEDPDASLSEIADIILFDPIITANLLRTCNSAYFALPRRIDSVHEAVSLLGLEQIVDVVLLKSGVENLKNKQEGYGLNEGDLWRYSVSSALIAREIATRKGVKNKQLIFTAALLKDIGKVILDRFVAGAFHNIQELVQQNGYSFMEAEKKVIGVDHAELGGLVASSWNFSEKMVYIIRNHHLANEAARQDLECSIVYLSDILCMMMGIGVGSDGLAYRFHDDVIKSLGFSEKELLEIIAGFGENMSKVEDLIRSV